MAALPGFYVTAIRVLRDGRVALAGGEGAAIEVAVLRADGSLDPTFGAAGRAVIDVVGASQSDADSVVAIAEAGSGQVVVISADGDVVRLDRIGRLDRSFGDDGVAARPPVRPSSPRFGVDVAVQRDGRIVVLAVNLADCDRCYESRELYRLTPSGRLDRSFASTTAEANEPSGSRLILDSHDRLLVTGGLDQPFVDRLLRSGRPDRAFSGDGTFGDPLFFGEDPSLAVDERGRVLVATSGGGLARLSARGRLDANFGSCGIAASPPGGRPMFVAAAPGSRVLVTSVTPTELRVARLLGTGRRRPAAQPTVGLIAPSEIELERADERRATRLRLRSADRVRVSVRLYARRGDAPARRIATGSVRLEPCAIGILRLRGGQLLGKISTASDTLDARLTIRRDRSVTTRHLIDVPFPF